MVPVYEELPISFPVNILRFSNYCSGERTHWHEEIELQYVVKGKTQSLCNLQTNDLCAGDILFVNSNEPHTGNNLLQENTFYCFHINKEFFTNHIGSEHIIFENHIRDPQCAAILDDIIRCQHTDGYKNKIFLGKLVYTFIELVAQKHVKTVLNENDSAKYSKYNSKFNDIVCYIDEHSETPLTVSDIASHFFMSESYLSHFFKKHSGKSIIQYLNSIRILKAQRLLEQTDLSVGEIAGLVGFYDINYFTRKFRMTNGITPTQHRAKSRKQ